MKTGAVLGNWYAADLKEMTILNKICWFRFFLKKKFRERGYNQVTTFDSLSKELGIPYNDSFVSNYLFKTQSQKNRWTDRRNRCCFDVYFNDKDHDKHYLLVDDVITTGATLEACSRALLKIPGARVSIVCMAMAQS
jgi:predicted amidophosphoribosyltransferase